jgi:hypothetical protein
MNGDDPTPDAPLKKYTVRMEDGTVYHGVLARSSAEAMDRMSKGPQGPLAPRADTPPTPQPGPLVAQPDVPGRAEAGSFGTTAKNLLTGLLPIGGALAGGGAAALAGRGPLLSALARMTGAGAGGAVESKLRGEEPLTGGVLSAATQGIAGEVPSLIGRGMKLARSGPALRGVEDQAAAKVVTRSEASVPWWQGKFEPSHKGLVEMAQGEGPPLAQKGFGETMRKIMPWLKGETVDLTLDEARKLGVPLAKLPMRTDPVTKEVVAVEVPLDTAVDKVTGQSGTGGVSSKLYRTVTMAADRALTQSPAPPELKGLYQQARKAYAYASAYQDVMNVPGVIDPVTKRLRLDILSQSVIKKKLLNTAATEGRAPEMRRLLREIAPLTTESPLRTGVRLPFSSAHVGPMRFGEGAQLPYAKNVPGYGPGPLLRATPYVGGAIGQEGRELLSAEGE